MSRDSRGRASFQDVGTFDEQSRQEKGATMWSFQKKVLGQIVALTKNIWLMKPADRASYIAQFSVGKQSPRQPLGTFGIEWWHTNESFRAREAVAALLIGAVPEFNDCDSEAIERAIDDTMHEICTDRRLFEGDEVCFAKKPYAPIGTRSSFPRPITLRWARPST